MVKTIIDGVSPVSIPNQACDYFHGLRLIDHFRTIRRASGHGILTPPGGKSEPGFGASGFLAGETGSGSEIIDQPPSSALKAHSGCPIQ
ncbi:MAG: hypothetical protein R6U43_04605 [Candidatus Krumholzibacteriales bacterium]